MHDLLLKMAFDLAPASESAELNVHNFPSLKLNLKELYFVKGTSERNQILICCGVGYRGAECRYKDATCHKGG